MFLSVKYVVKPLSQTKNNIHIYKKVALSLPCSKYINSHRSEVGYMLEVELAKE